MPMSGLWSFEFTCLWRFQVVWMNGFPFHPTAFYLPSHISYLYPNRDIIKVFLVLGFIHSNPIFINKKECLLSLGWKAICAQQCLTAYSDGCSHSFRGSRKHALQDLLPDPFSYSWQELNLESSACKQVVCGSASLQSCWSIQFNSIWAIQMAQSCLTVLSLYSPMCQKLFSWLNLFLGTQSDRQERNGDAAYE